MSMALLPDTQAILLLTAPLIAGRGQPSSYPLAPGEYKRLARFLRDRQRRPADLLGPDSRLLLGDCMGVDTERVARLLDRGFLLSQAVERWQNRAIWVISRADAEYPRRLKERVKEDAPPVLYGCGDTAILGTGGLAVVGSRHVEEALVEYAEGVGRLAATSGRTLVSGGARGIDQAAMRGALEADGRVAAVLADSLERTALLREHRNLLMDGQLVLLSPYDPSAGFNVGHAMQRNKLVYALADAALVISSDYEKGGTWAGAVEQLERLHFVPVYVRANGDSGAGLRALEGKGALPWTSPSIPEELDAMLAAQPQPRGDVRDQDQYGWSEINEPAHEYRVDDHDGQAEQRQPASLPAFGSSPADSLFATVRSLAERMDSAKTEQEVAAEWNVSRSQAKAWLQRLVKEGVLEECKRPVRYRAISTQTTQTSLFAGQD